VCRWTPSAANSAPPWCTVLGRFEVAAVDEREAIAWGAELIRLWHSDDLFYSISPLYVSICETHGNQNILQLPGS